MLPPFIIEQIRKREQEQRRPVREHVVELPLPTPGRPREPRPGEEESDRGVVIIDLV